MGVGGSNPSRGASFVKSVDAEKSAVGIQRERQRFESGNMATVKYQIELRTSNLPGLVYTGEMDPNERGGSLLTNLL